MSGHPARTGWSLIETLVVAALVAVVLGVVIPSLRVARTTAWDRADAASLRTHAQAFSLYSGDHDGILPRFIEPGRDGSIPIAGGGEVEFLRYFDAFDTWHIALAESYYGTVFSDEIFFSRRTKPLQRPEYPFRSEFLYPCSFVAAPEFWSPTSRTGIGQLRGVALAIVRYPSAKALLTRAAAPDARVDAGQKIMLALSDGGVRFVGPTERIAGYPRGDGPEFQSVGAVHFKDDPPILHTLNGALGRDLR